MFLSLIEYAFVNVMMGDISEVEQKAKKNHLRNITYQIVLTWMLEHLILYPNLVSQDTFVGFVVVVAVTY